MADDFAEKVLQRVVSQVCLDFGYESIDYRALRVLSNVLREYIATMGEYSRETTHLAHRSKVGTQDIISAIQKIAVLKIICFALIQKCFLFFDREKI